MNETVSALDLDESILDLLFLAFNRKDETKTDSKKDKDKKDEEIRYGYNKINFNTFGSNKTIESIDNIFKKKFTKELNTFELLYNVYQFKKNCKLIFLFKLTEKLDG